ncbi:hypothetical protein SBBP2_1030006 [Burkholderiales bacterium]|nr:hypothetical protein SBBP2_1030006 [Burkholderiales bacterium]
MPGQWAHNACAWCHERVYGPGSWSEFSLFSRCRNRFRARRDFRPMLLVAHIGPLRCQRRPASLNRDRCRAFDSGTTAIGSLARMAGAGGASCLTPLDYQWLCEREMFLFATPSKNSVDLRSSCENPRPVPFQACEGPRITATRSSMSLLSS